jgi:hypothetical protein
MKKDINIQSFFKKLTEEIEESTGQRVMFTIDDEAVDQLFNKQFEAEVDYYHDGPDVYYVTYQNDLEKFVDYVESLGLDSDRIQIQQYMREEGGVTGGGEAYLPALNAPSKKINPFKQDKLEEEDPCWSGYQQIGMKDKDGRQVPNCVPVKEDKYSGYTQDKNFRPGHTPDKGGFQYKDIWGLNEAEDIEGLKQKVISWSRQHRSDKEGSLEKGWWKEFEDAVMAATNKAEVRDAVLDVYYADSGIFDKLGLMDLDYDDSEKSTDPLMKKSISNEEELQRVQGLLDRANQEKSYSVMSGYENRIKKLKFLVSLQKKIGDKLPLLNFADDWGDYVKNKLAWNGNPNKFADIAAHVQRLMEPPWQPKMETLQEMNKIVDEVFSPEDYRKVLQVIEKIKYTNTTLYNAILDMISDIYPHDYGEVEAQMGINENIERDQKVKITGGRHAGNTAIVHDFDSDKDVASGDDWVDVLMGSKKEKKTVKASELKPINENYARFRNETKTRTKPEQFHEAVKSVKRKVQEINKLYEYMERLKLELSESSDGLKYKKYTENAIIKIKEAVKALHIKTKKLK